MGIQHLLGRIVDGGDQRLPRGGDQGEPGVLAAIEVDQFPEARPRLPAAAMPPARPPLAHQARRLQRLLHERIGPRDAMLAPRHLIEVPHVEPRVAIARPIALRREVQDPLHLRHRYRPWRGRVMPMIVQPGEPVPLVPPAQPPHRACANAQDLGDLDPRLPALQRLHQDLVDLHGRLYRRLGVGHRHLPRGHDSPSAGWERSDHLLSGADKSCTRDSGIRFS